MQRDFGDPRGATVLVAARDDGLEEVIRAARPEGRYRVDRARSVRELERLLALNGADGKGRMVVVLDDDLDEAAGPGLVRELLAANPGLKILWVPAHLSNLIEFEVRRLGVFYILPRPVEPSLLTRLVSKAAEHMTRRAVR